ncbi:MAG: ABC transporter ATP-binding protein [Geminicoccaceae bacterium]
MIDIRDLDIRFGQGRRATHAVRNVSIQVPEGQSFGLVGESGSGKSTVLRAIAGLVPDYGGDIIVAGETLGSRRSKAFQRRVQMVFQDPYGALHPRQTIDQIIKEPLSIHGLDRSDGRITQALEDVGLDRSFRFRFPHQISGGQRQRVAIARALVMEPKVLLLDEPTSALDVSIQAEVLNLLTRLRREHGLTFLLVSHNLAVIAHMCEQVAVMNGGEIVEQLDIDRLRAEAFENDYTRQLFRAARGYDAEVAKAALQG